MSKTTKHLWEFRPFRVDPRGPAARLPAGKRPAAENGG